jgi:hypothetical protein
MVAATDKISLHVGNAEEKQVYLIISQEAANNYKAFSLAEDGSVTITFPSRCLLFEII